MKLGYTIIYVSDVASTVAFYEAAFQIKCRFTHESTLYAEMETGSSTLAFSDESSLEINGLAITPNRRNTPPSGWEICFVTDDVASAYVHALEHGASAVSPPAEKPWGQTVSYVRDINGCLVEIASPVTK